MLATLHHLLPRPPQLHSALLPAYASSSRRLRRRDARPRVVATVREEEAAAPAPASVAVEEATSGSGPTKFSVKIPVGDRHILVETGHIGRQAGASDNGHGWRNNCPLFCLYG